MSTTVSADNLSENQEGFTIYNGILFTGVAVENYDNGNRLSQTPYRNGLIHGVQRFWHLNEHIAIEDTLSLGQTHGYRREWHLNG